MPTLADYGTDFQRKVVALMLQDPAFLKYVEPYLKPDLFSDEIDAGYARIMLDYIKAYPTGTFTPLVLMTELKKMRAAGKLKEEEGKLYVKRFEELIKPVKEKTYILGEIEEFAVNKSLEAGYIEGIDLLKKKRYKDSVDIINKAYDKSKRQSLRETHFPIISAMPKFFDRLEDPEDLAKKKGFPTGVKELDESLFANGVDIGELLIYCAPPNRGKSQALLNAAAACQLKGHSGLYYTLEMANTIYRQRYLAMLTSVPFATIAANLSVVKERWEKVNSVHKLGEMIMIDLPARQLKPSDIRRDIEFYRNEGVDIKWLIVDYADIMSSDKSLKIENRRFEQGDIYEALRGLTKEFQVAGFTASQGSKASMTKYEVDMDVLAEDFSKAMTADYVIGMSQTKKEKADKPLHGGTPRGTGKMRLFIAKNRTEENGSSVEIYTDFTKARLNYDDWERHDLRLFS